MILQLSLVCLEFFSASLGEETGNILIVTSRTAGCHGVPTAVSRARKLVAV